MIQTAIASFLTASIIGASTVLSLPHNMPAAQVEQAQTQIASRSMSLNTRYGGVELPENAYKDNILLNLAYMSGSVKGKNDINWDNLRKPVSMEFSLEPGQRFAYHDTLLAEYAENVVLTTNSKFNAAEGYKYSDGLYGMGVCHLASLIHWVAKDAGLESIAPSNHDFYPIPEIPKEYGVAIYSHPDQLAASANQNLYIKNTLDVPVTFKFNFDGTNLKVTALK